MPVYMVRAGSDGPVKIGYANEDGVIARLGIIQTNNHVPLTLIRVLEGDLDIEQAIHQHFAHLRLHHEWFAWVPEMEGDLGIPEWLPAAAWHKPWPIMENGDPALSSRKSVTRKRQWSDPAYKQRMADAMRLSFQNRRAARLQAGGRLTD